MGTTRQAPLKMYIACKDCPLRGNDIRDTCAGGYEIQFKRRSKDNGCPRCKNDIPWTELTAAAWEIACIAHRGQKDKAGAPYILHPYHLAAQMGDEVSAATALLHDVLEDTEVTAEDLAAAGIPKNVIQTVKALTRQDGETYFEYIERLKRDPIAVVVKKEDLKHNLDLSRLGHEPDKADLRRARKYEKALRILETEG